MKLTRRSVLSLIPPAGLSLAGAAGLAAPPKQTAETFQLSEEIPLVGWEFSFAGTEPPAWRPVQVPHTWQALGGDPNHVGVGVYRIKLQPKESWRDRWVRVEFEAATHTAHVTLNGKPLGSHIGKGYTAFTVDLPPALLSEEGSMLQVEVDNRPSDTMLPRNDSYDWTNDGGLIRPVRLLITPRVFIERVEIDSELELTAQHATVAIRAVVRNTTDTAQRFALEGRFFPEADPQTVQRFARASGTIAPATTQIVELSHVDVPSPLLWHFDAPHLYAAECVLHTPLGSHGFVDTFGIRKFEARGTQFYLNGEAVSLIGVERMAGSNPDFGMAETTDWIRNNHDDMKELNCIFTRVHWAQDRRVLDYCDRHGILMQTEVPAWGPATFHQTSDATQHALEQNGLEQLREMIARDRNHPSIVAWGLCNEVDGKNPRTQQFARTLSREARRLDPQRLQTYASNTLHVNPAEDMAGEFDFVSANEYYGSWAPGGVPDVRAFLARIRAAFPNRPIVISEYGWCECQPSILPGDDNRVAIVDGHTEVFRESGTVAGAIYFDYNDYRTLVGDHGQGAMKQRVHGVVDLYARRKPSFEALRRQASPIESLSCSTPDPQSLSIVLRTRQRVPGYTLRGYRLRWVVAGYDDLPMSGGVEDLPELAPGAEHRLQFAAKVRDARSVTVDILRPTGFSIATLRYPLQDALR